MPRDVSYPHPGEILSEEFMLPMDITAYRLAKEIGVDQTRIGEIISGRRAITVEPACASPASSAPVMNSGPASNWTSIPLI
ncbi:addiction module HigA family antidote [Paraburkholderia silvatlantica]|uniref:Addiction module HigA family antidote n=1 Tax=Paraburkholderia silvatlantica TaxID=321895 RepID=A0A2V4TTU7_9BURK|nr:addiction module HigA family antidote [Paraburkholderia silvatlantica]